MKQYDRQQVVQRLNAKLASGKIIVAAGAGTGISAKFEEEGGADLIMVFNSGRYRRTTSIFTITCKTTRRPCVTSVRLSPTGPWCRNVSIPC
jgi:predicted TIM-barrel enzyme